MLVESLGCTGWKPVGANVRFRLKPTAVPRTTGSRIEAAGLVKTDDGSVREGM